MHLMQGLVLILLAHDLLSLLAYPVITHPPQVADNLTIRTVC